jgi:hypothetical protein
MGNLPLSASNPSFPPTLNWSLLQGRNVAHQLWSRRGTRPTLKRKKKIFHEANRGEESVASGVNPSDQTTGKVKMEYTYQTVWQRRTGMNGRVHTREFKLAIARQ